jgi:hypothetical protein
VIETKLLSAWDSLVGSVALLAIIVLSFCVMVSAVKPSDVPRHLGAIVGVVILLIMLPAIIMGLWNTLSLGQHLRIIVVCAAITFLVGSSRRRPTNARRK